MAKWVGTIGYKIDELNDTTGVWTNQIIEKRVKGELNRVSSRNQSSSNGINDDINIANTVCIFGDRFANSHLQQIVYVSFAGNYWKVSNIEVAYPRLTLSIGGVYNGERPS